MCSPHEEGNLVQETFLQVYKGDRRRFASPLALAALGELKLVEIVEVLGPPEGMVRRRIHTARATLRQELLEQKVKKP